MASISKFPSTVSQTTGGKYCSFSNLNNIKNSISGSWAVSNVLIQGKSETPNRPSTITGTNFKFNLPEGAEPTKVIVTYRHQKVEGSDWTSKNKHIMNIPAPTISLVGVSGFSGKGVAPTRENMVTSTKTFNVKGKVKRTQINSSNFGFKLNYPTNSNAYNGYMRVSYVNIKVEYTVSKYSVSVKKTSGTGYNKEDYTIQLSISNKNKTSYNPTLTLTSPVGFSFKSSKGTGSINQVNTRTFTWNPNLSSKVGTSSINLTFSTDVTYPSGSSSYTGTFTLVESLNATTSNHNATITERPSPDGEETDDGESIFITDEEASVKNPEVHNVNIGEVFQLNLDASDWLDMSDGENLDFIYGMWCFYDPQFDKYDEFDYSDSDLAGTKMQWQQYGWDEDDWINFTYGVTFLPDYYESGHLDLNFKANNLGEYVIIIFRAPSGTSDNEPYKYVKITVIPNEDTLTIPFFSILEPGEEELNRLGDGYPYVLQSNFKHTTNDKFVRDWYKNNRIGVFNNPIEDNITITETIDPETGEVIETITDSTDYDNLTPTDLFNYAGYWSSPIGNVNSFENLECEFVYNKNYPFYILFTGDYQEADSNGYDGGIVTYNEPCIIEKDVYKEREANGVYPAPIKSLILEDGDSAEVNIESLNSTSPIIFYDFPLDEGYGSNDEMSIRGMEIGGNIEQADELVLSAKLISDKGTVGERTIVLNDQNTTVDSDNEFKIGGLGDLWGFSSADITNLEDWELELIANNILLEDVANLNFGDVHLILYTKNLEKQDINIKVEGEDLSYYGAFIEQVSIPEGLETDTSFLSIDGTDTNDAYRQNIREKEIEIEFTIGECDIGTSTDLLRQLTKLLVNDKDSYNRPIPKRIEFSHYPDVYFEYIMVEAMDITSEQSFYNVKVKLVIPSGTAYSKQTTTTNIRGFVQGLASINPTISFKPQSSVVEIRELVTDQKFSMGYPEDWQTKIVELDCENRIAYLKTNDDDTQPVDISRYVDFNSDWFAIKGEYSFSGTNCVIRTVEYTERW